MTPEQQKEQFSIAYTHALAAQRKINIARLDVDEDSVDLVLRRSGGIEPQVSLQLKCSGMLDATSDPIEFPLKHKNYEELRKNCLVPKLLVVLRVPQNPEDWIYADAEHLLLRHRAYWLNLRGYPDPPPFTGIDVRNQKIPVMIPRGHLLSADQMMEFLDTIEATGTL